MTAREEAIRKPGRQKRGKDSRRIPNRELKEAELGFLDAQARRAALDCFKHSIFAAVPGGLKLKRSRSEIRKSTLWRVHLTLIKHGDQWQIMNFRVNSPALLPE
jgi:hypothetical protein